MKTIHLTASQARHHFPNLFDHAVTRRGQGLPYSQEDASSFDEDLFVIASCPAFERIPLPANVRFGGSEDGSTCTSIKNAASMPKEITAVSLVLDNYTIDNEHVRWDASVIDRVTCLSDLSTKARLDHPSFGPLDAFA